MMRRQRPMPVTKADLEEHAELMRQYTERIEAATTQVQETVAAVVAARPAP